MLTRQNMAKPNLSITFLLKLGRKVAVAFEYNSRSMASEGRGCMFGSQVHLTIFIKFSADMKHCDSFKEEILYQYDVASHSYQQKGIRELRVRIQDLI